VAALESEPDADTRRQSMERLQALGAEP